jgi:hypothetical protein
VEQYYIPSTRLGCGDSVLLTELPNLQPTLFTQITADAGNILVGKPEGKRPLGRPRCTWVDNIKMNLREMGWHGLD